MEDFFSFLQFVRREAAELGVDGRTFGNDVVLDVVWLLGSGWQRCVEHIGKFVEKALESVWSGGN